MLPISLTWNSFLTVFKKHFLTFCSTLKKILVKSSMNNLCKFKILTTLSLEFLQNFQTAQCLFPLLVQKSGLIINLFPNTYWLLHNTWLPNLEDQTALIYYKRALMVHGPKSSWWMIRVQDFSCSCIQVVTVWILEETETEIETDEETGKL